MKRWGAPRDPWIALAVLGILILGGGVTVAAQRLLRDLRGPLDSWPITLLTFSLALGVVAGVIGIALLVWSVIDRATLRYELDRNAIYVVRRSERYTIPLHQITAAHALDKASQAGTLPAMRFGWGRAGQTLQVTTEQRSYRLALADRVSFERELHERRQLGIVQPQREGPTYTWPTLRRFWHTPAVGRLLALTLLLNLALWALLAWRYPLLPDTIPVRFDPVGGTAGTRARTYTLLLPGVATAIGLGNLGLAALLHRRTELAAELLLLGAVLVQAVLLIALWFVGTVSG